MTSRGTSHSGHHWTGASPDRSVTQIVREISALVMNVPVARALSLRLRRRQPAALPFIEDVASKWPRHDGSEPPQESGNPFVPGQLFAILPNQAAPGVSDITRQPGGVSDITRQPGGVSDIAIVP